MHVGNGWHEETQGARKVFTALLSGLFCNSLPGKGRKLHIAPDFDTGEITVPRLTSEHVCGETPLPDSLAEADANVAQFLADRVY